MIQVRCAECGYLQTLSEERFLSISEDFLNCPHCNARVPKQWAPVDSDSVPEEARHKILAFSRRILNGGEVGREVVYALESLVRHHGALEFSNKALGMGYACLGDAKKAEEFLIQAQQESPDDLEVRRCLTKVLLDRKKFSEALEVARSVMDSAGAGLWDQDVARAAHALIELGRIDEARSLLDSHPNLDPRNPAVKAAKKLLSRGSGAGLGSRIGSTFFLQKLWSNVTIESVTSLTRRAKDLVRPHAANSSSHEDSVSNRRSRGPETTSAKSPEGAMPRECTLEYWIYTQSAEIPLWDQIRQNLSRRWEEQADKERASKRLESLIEENHLTIDYILKSEAAELFCYPEDLIPQNSRGLSNGDREILMKAEMIVRLRVSDRNTPILEALVFMTEFVDAVRRLTGGLVQDAMSHVLWGTQEWENRVHNPKRNPLESELNIEVLDEGEGVWVHTHGMRKFGFPDLELEGIPSAMGLTAKKLVLRVAELLQATGERDWRNNVSFPLPGTSCRFKLEQQEPDDEGHFLGGSLKIVPIFAGEPADSGTALVQFLKDFQSQSGRTRSIESSKGYKRDLQGQDFLREELLSAHNRARHSLVVFKKSFRNCRHSDGNVHAVKVGFRGQQGEYEWMWVKLDSWRGHSLEGLLQNSPIALKDVHKGSRVHLNVADIFDWAIVSPDKLLDGAFTENIPSS